MVESLILGLSNSAEFAQNCYHLPLRKDIETKSHTKVWADIRSDQLWFVRLPPITPKTRGWRAKGLREGAGEVAGVMKAKLHCDIHHPHIGFQ